MESTVNINNNRYGNGCFCSCYSYGEQREEKALKLAREKYAVEYSEVDIYRIQDKFHRNQHCYQVTTGNKTKHADKKQKRAKH